MRREPFSLAREVLIWSCITIALITPILAATQSPLLAWRDPIYIAAGFCGIFGLAFLLIQPLLAGRLLPGVSIKHQRLLHRVTGVALLLAVIAHVTGLWITSPPDVIDALLFASPTPFSIWGVIAMWAVFASATVALQRRRLHIPFQTWRLVHILLAVIIVIGTIVHTLLIQGTMETASKIAFCAALFVVNFKVLAGLFNRPKRHR